MRILHIATNDIVGGASRAAYRIHLGLRRAGHDSVMFVAKKTSDDPAIFEYRLPQRLFPRASRVARGRYISRSLSRYNAGRPEGYDIFSDDRASYGRDWFGQLPECDLINLHWVAGFVDYRRFFSRAPHDIPIVWRLADMNPFTGGCHFDHECGRFMTGCGRCPQLGSGDSRDLSHQIWKRKLETFKKAEAGRLHLVVLNQSAADTVKASPLLGKFPVTVIPNGVDTDEFAPRDRRMAREILDLPSAARIVLFAADVLHNRRKGLNLLLQALRGLEKIPNLLLLSMGGGRPEVPAGIEHRHLGRIRDDRMLSIIYSAVDLFIFPSLQETFGQAAMEAMACGTPVVGFEGVGCIPELVHNGITGQRVPLEDVTELRSTISTLLLDFERLDEMRDHCRKIIVEKFNLGLQAKRYAQLYRNLIEGVTVGSEQMQPKHMPTGPESIDSKHQTLRTA